MRTKLSLAALALLLCLCPLSAAFSDPAAKPPATATPGKIDPQVLAKIVPGISKSQVQTLLGNPWRTVQYNDLDELENEFWEYRGTDAQGPYRVHIEFDPKGTVLIVGKIPDRVAGGKGTPAKS
jgi:hypothetical protein